MADADVPNRIVLFWYKASPYGRRIAWYLTLRNIHYAECVEVDVKAVRGRWLSTLPQLQPPIMPRPALASLGVNYRRIPVVAIGRDIYLDTRLIMAKLEELFPPSAAHPALSAKEAAGLTALLQKFTIDAGTFAYAARMIPLDLPMMRDRRFQKDRAEFFPRQQDPLLARAEGVVHMRQCFDVVESLLADGRQWIAGTEGPSLADLEGIWPFDWVIGNLQPPAEYFSASLYPKVYAWQERFQAAVKAAKARAPKAVSLSDEQAVQFIIGSEPADGALTVESDPCALQQGAFVQLFPLDGGGVTHQDSGRLVKLTKSEVGVAVQAASGQEICIHAPRWQFRIRKTDGGGKL